MTPSVPVHRLLKQWCTDWSPRWWGSLRWKSCCRASKHSELVFPVIPCPNSGPETLSWYQPFQQMLEAGGSLLSGWVILQARKRKASCFLSANCCADTNSDAFPKKQPQIGMGAVVVSLLMNVYSYNYEFLLVRTARDHGLTGLTHTKIDCRHIKYVQLFRVSKFEGVGRSFQCELLTYQIGNSNA